MTGKQTVRGVAAAALVVVAMGSAAPAEAAPWPAPTLHGGDSATPEPASAGDHGMTEGEMGEMDHGDHMDDGDHGATEGHSGHSGTEGHDDQGATEGHDDHGATEGHGADTGDEHETGHETGHGQEPDTVADSTKVGVLSGFGAVNAAAVGGAILLRRRDRRADRSRTRREDRRGRTVR